MSVDMIKTIRSKQLAARRALLPAHVKQASKQVIGQLKESAFFKCAMNVGVYRPIGNEINPWLDPTLFDGKQLYLPVMTKAPAPHLTFYAYTSGDTLLLRSFGIEEPDPTFTRSFPIEALDVLLVPLVVFDRVCHRVGYGAGYYDRSLAFKKNSPATGPFLIGLAHHSQGVDRLPVKDWDVPMDVVITDHE